MKSLKITQSITDRQDASLGKFFKEVSKIPMASIDEEIELSRKIKSGDQAATNRLVEANLRFVISVAKQYQNRGLPLVDLIQAGCCGCIEAARRWDESRGFKFISYAVWWIRQAIVHSISSQCRTVRIPMSQVAYSNKINKVIERFEQENGRKPVPEEIEEETNMTSDKISLTLLSSSKTISLETPFKDEENGCLLDIIPDSNSEDADNSISKRNISEVLENILDKLPFRERDILRMSFGIGMLAMQNEEIANRFGVGAERVRQIQHEAIERIKKDHIQLLKELL